MITYRAIESASNDLEIFSKSASQSGFVNSISEMISELKQFNISYEKLEVIAEEIENETLKLKLKDLKFFLDKFTLDYILTMPIEEYASGRNNKESFCYMVEETFDCFGAISGRTTAFQKFVIYWSDEEQEYLFGDKRTKQRKQQSLL